MCCTLVIPHSISVRMNYIDREGLHVENCIPNDPVEFQVYETDGFFFCFLVVFFFGL